MPDGAVISPCVGRICQTFALYLQHKNILFPPQTRAHTHTHLQSDPRMCTTAFQTSPNGRRAIPILYASCTDALFARVASVPAVSRLFHALRPPPLIASALSPAPSSAPRPRPRIGAVSPLGAQLAIIADLTPNSQLAPARRSVLIIYRLPQHLQLTVDQRAAALFLLTLPLKKQQKCNVEHSQIVLWRSGDLNSRMLHFFLFFLVWGGLFMSFHRCAMAAVRGCHPLCSQLPREQPEGGGSVPVAMLTFFDIPAVYS